MINNQTLVELALKLRQIADELEHGTNAEILTDCPPPAQKIQPGQAAEPALEDDVQPVTESVSERIQARVENDHETSIRNIACCAKIPSSLALRLRLVFAANLTVKKGDWYTSAIRRHLNACQNKTGKDLSTVLQHVSSREREPKTLFISAQLDAQMRSFLVHHNVSITRFLCSAFQRQIEACEQINNGPFLL